MERDKCIRVRFTCTQGDSLLELRDVAFLNSFVFSHVAIRSMCCCCTAFLVLLLVLRGPCSVPQMQHCFRSEALLSILPIRGLPCKLAHATCALAWTNFPGAQWGFAAFSFLPGRVSRDQEYMCFWQFFWRVSSILQCCIYAFRSTPKPGLPDA